jgi:hypothetical protein
MSPVHFESPLLSSATSKPEKKKIVPQSPHVTPHNGLGLSSNDWINLGRLFKNKAEQAGKSTVAGAVYYTAATLCYFTRQSLCSSDYVKWFEGSKGMNEFCHGKLYQHRKVLNDLFVIYFFCEGFFTLRASNEMSLETKQLVHKTKKVARLLTDDNPDVKVSDIAKDVEEKLGKAVGMMEDQKKLFDRASLCFKEAFRLSPQTRIDD